MAISQLMRTGRTRERDTLPFSSFARPTQTEPATAPTTTSTPVSNEGPQFDDPSIRRLESHAINQYEANANPGQDSASTQYENYLGTLGTQLQGPAYNSSEAAIYQGAALDAMEREKTAAKDRWMQELSRRGIPPTSGIALDGILKIDNHYAGLRTTQQTDFAKQAIQDTRQNRMQAANVLGQRVQAEQGRQQLAGQYAAQPYQLGQDAFSRNVSLVTGQQPGAYLNSQLGVAQGQMQQQLRDAKSNEDLMAYLAYYGLI